jgi:hypothetical protein
MSMAIERLLLDGKEEEEEVKKALDALRRIRTQVDEGLAP